MEAFLSYSADDKEVAARIKGLLDGMQIGAFMAHEDIGVSEEWRIALLKKLQTADLFIAILSARYFASVWCVQESGIAAFRNMVVIPLSIDDTIPRGFIAHIQCTKINPDMPASDPIIRGIGTKDVSLAIDAAINRISAAGSFRAAEARFQTILPYLQSASDQQMRRLLLVSLQNGQVSNALLCARDYLPPLLKAHGHLLDDADRQKLADIIGDYTPGL